MKKIFTEQDITIYHKVAKNYIKMNLKGSFRGTSIRNRTQSGVNTTDNGLVRIFEDIEVASEDIVVNKFVEDIENISLTMLKEKYGKHNVFLVKSVDYFMVGTKLDHVKIGII